MNEVWIGESESGLQLLKYPVLLEASEAKAADRKHRLTILRNP